MPTPRFQIFVSSTFRDLVDERRAVLDAILEMNHIPAGMEMFPASDSTPSAIIEGVIRDSDYYVLIVGGRYGSTDADGISYTELEYEYAVKQGKSVLAFLHGDPDLIPAGKCEMKPKAQAKLSAFRKKVETRHCKYWKTADDLKSQVVIGLLHAFSTHPAVGWVRADGIDNHELLGRLAALQQRYDHVKSENARLSVPSVARPKFEIREAVLVFGQSREKANSSVLASRLTFYVEASAGSKLHAPHHRRSITATFPNSAYRPVIFDKSTPRAQGQDNMNVRYDIARSSSACRATR